MGLTAAAQELLTTFVAARLALILHQDPRSAREHYSRGLDMAQRNGWQRAAGHWMLHLGDLAVAPYGDVLSLGYLLVEDRGRLYARTVADSSGLGLSATWGITPQGLTEAERWYAAAQATAMPTEAALAPSVFAMRTAYLAFRRSESSAIRLYEAAAHEARKDGAVLTEIMARASHALLSGEQTSFAEAFDIASRQQYPGAMLSMVELALSHAMRLLARGEAFAAATSLALAAMMPEQGWERAHADLLRELSKIEFALGRPEAEVRRLDDAIALHQRHIAQLVEAAQLPWASELHKSGFMGKVMESEKYNVATMNYTLISSLERLYLNERLARWNERVQQAETVVRLLPRNQDLEKLDADLQSDNERVMKSLREWHRQTDCARILRSFAQQDATRPPHEQPRALVQVLVMASECEPSLLGRAQGVLKSRDPVAPVAAALKQFRQEMSFPALQELQQALRDLNSWFLLAGAAKASPVLAHWAQEALQLAQEDTLLEGLVPAARFRQAQALLIEGKAAPAQPLLETILTTESLQSPTAFRDLRMDVLRALVDVHVQLGRPEEALLAVERVRADQDWWQAVITRIHEDHPQSAKLAMLERDVALSGAGSSPRLLALERQALTGQLPPRVLPTLEALRASLQAVPLDTIVLAYYPLHPHLIIWRAEHGQPLRMIKVPAAVHKLGRDLDQFKQQLRGDEATWQASSAELFRLLVAPVGPLPSGRTLAIVGADTLGDIPFEALGATASRLLIQDHPVVYVSSLGARVIGTRPPSEAGQRVMVVGRNGPSLTRAEEEAWEVAGLYGAIPLDGSQATVDEITARLPAARVVHLSTHGVMDPVNPYRSYLALQDGRLTVWQLFDAAAQAELIVLSACDTKQGQRSLAPVGRLRDFQSVTALLAAGGARRVVASLWQADEDAGFRIMVAFHRALAQDRGKPAAALQQAKLTLAASPEHQPYLWATYTLSVRDLAAIRIDVP